MFARTFSIKPENVNLSDPGDVVSFISNTILQEIRGRRPFQATIFADVSLNLGRIVFYDVSLVSQVIEFNSIFHRLPQYSITMDEKSVKIYHLCGKAAIAQVISLDIEKAGAVPVINGACIDAEKSQQETESLRTVTSVTEGFIEAASQLAGTVICSAVENKDTREHLAFFTLKVDSKSEKSRAIIRSAKEVLFAWSNVTSYMILICQFRMLPLFSVSFPLLGRNIVEAMDLYTRSQKGVGMVMFTDDVSDTFFLEKGKPTFD